MKNALILLALAVPGTALAETPARTGTAAAASADTRVVCRRDTSVGSRLGVRVCLTRAQWRERDGDNRDRTRDLVDNSERQTREAFIPGDQPVP